MPAEQLQVIEGPINKTLPDEDLKLIINKMLLDPANIDYKEEADTGRIFFIIKGEDE